MGPEIVIIGIILFGILVAGLASLSEGTASQSDAAADPSYTVEHTVEIQEGIDSIAHPFYQDVYSHHE